MVFFIRNDKVKLKPISVCRYLCIVPKHIDDVWKFQNIAVFKYQLINISACVQCCP